MHMPITGSFFYKFWKIFVRKNKQRDNSSATHPPGNTGNEPLFAVIEYTAESCKVEVLETRGVISNYQ